MIVSFECDGIDAKLVRVVVVVPTFLRPVQLSKTLQSLAQQSVDHFVAVIVENDSASKEGLAAVRVAAGDHPDLKCLCVEEPRQGNVYAINTGFEAALDLFPRSEFILMMDDDEIATPDWLLRMLAAVESSGADIVGGPVEPDFAAPVPAYIRNHPAFWPNYNTSGFVPLIYGSGNCLIRRRVFERFDRPYFDPRFNFLGGGDADFFVRSRMKGATFWWEQEALISEMVPRERTKTSWLLSRGMRIGAINRLVDRRTRMMGVVSTSTKDLAVFIAAIASMSVALIRAKGFLRALHPVAIAIGRYCSIFNLEPQQYRSAPSRPRQMKHVFEKTDDQRHG